MREASSGAFAVHEVARDLGVLCIHTNSETSSLTADPKQHIPNAFRTARQGVHDFDRRRQLCRRDRQGQGPEEMGDLLARLCLWPRHHRRVHAVPEALRARRRDHQRVLAKAVPARLHRGRHQDPAGEAAGAVFLPVGRRPHLLHRPGQHLRAVRPDGGVRGQHGRLHRADGGEEPAEGHPLRQPLHQDLPATAGECGLGRRLQGEVQRISDQLVVGERDRDHAARGGRRRRRTPPTARRSRRRCAG